MLLSDHVWIKSYRDIRCDLIGQGWVSFQDTENEVEERKSEVHKVLSTGRRVMTELNFGKLLIVNFTNNLLLGAMVFGWMHAIFIGVCNSAYQSFL